MTKEEKIIATAFTGKMFIDGSDMGLLYEYMEKKVGHGVIDFMLADKKFWEELHKACEQDFIDMVSHEQRSLPANLDEAAETYSKEVSNGHSYRDLICGFKAGAEWMEKEINKELIKAMEKVHEIRDVDYDIHVDYSADGSFNRLNIIQNEK